MTFWGPHITDGGSWLGYAGAMGAMGDLPTSNKQDAFILKRTFKKVDPWWSMWIPIHPKPLVSSETSNRLKSWVSFHLSRSVLKTCHLHFFQNDQKIIKRSSSSLLRLSLRRDLDLAHRRQKHLKSKPSVSSVQRRTAPSARGPGNSSSKRVR